MDIFLFTNSAWGKWGYSIIANPISKYLQNQGHQVWYFGMQSVHPPFKGTDGIIYLGLKHDLFGADILNQLINTIKPQVFFTMFDLFVDQARFMMDIPKNFPHIRWIHHATINSTPLAPVLRHCFQYPHVLVAPSKYNMQELVNAGFANKSLYIPHAIDTDVFKELPDDVKNKMKKRLGIQDKKFILLAMMKNKGMQKGYSILFYAWKSLLEKHSELKKEGAFLILSDVTSFEGINMDIVRLVSGTKDTVHFINTKFEKENDIPTGKLLMVPESEPHSFPHNTNYGFDEDEVSKLINIADCVISGSQGESFSLPLVESMSCGVPVIFNRFSTGKELVEDPKTGLVADLWTTQTTSLVSDIAVINEKSLAECLERMYMDKDFRIQCGENGKRFVRENYTWDKVLPEWKKLMDRVDENLKKQDYSMNNLGV